jgi:hypothetical protein
LTDAQAFILPPRRFKRLRIPGRIRGDWWNVKVTAKRAVPPVKVSLGAYSTFGLNKEMVRLLKGTYLKSDGVKPVSNVSSSNSFNRFAEFSLVLAVLSQELCEIVHKSKE